MTSLTLLPNGELKCGNLKCGLIVVKCLNYAQYDACNQCVVKPASVVGNAEPLDLFCNCCRFNRTIPDLSVTGNLQKWATLESAKRRLFYDLDQLRLPYGDASESITPPLAFDFKGDVLPSNNRWHSLNPQEKVYTGHDNGTITINIIEADAVEREKARVSLGEPQRTLLGHFRHEIGHYYWDVLVKNRREDECIAVFGDHNSPDYETALEQYYEAGPRTNWADDSISEYATMHPWEDFAETWALYLQILSELDTATNVGFLAPDALETADIAAIVLRSQRLSVALNELNRSMGLMDAMPKPIVAPVVEKLKFIHQLTHPATMN